MKRLLMLAALACSGCYARGGYYLDGPAYYPSPYYTPAPLLECTYIRPCVDHACCCYDREDHFLTEVACAR